MRLFGILAGGLLVLCVVVGAAVFAGYQLNTTMQNRFSFPARMAFKLNGMYSSFFNDRVVETKTIVTNRLILGKQEVFLPLSATDFAGGIAAMDADTVLVVDRVGKLFFVRNMVATELDVASPDNRVEALRAQLNEGLLGDIEIDFNWFRYNDILYVADGDESYLLLSYSDWRPEELCFGSTLARLKVEGRDPSRWRAEAGDWDVLMRTQPCLKTFTSGKGIYGLEAGGRLSHLEGRTVVWTSGSYERDDRFEGTDFRTALAQDDATDYGKVMLVDFLSGDKTTIAKGLRNPQGVSVMPGGDIWVTDHGMRGGDELNLVAPGKNFGFPAVSYGTRYNRTPAGNGAMHRQHDGYDGPVMAFVPSIAPSSAVAVHAFNPAWDGDILIGALSGVIQRVHVEAGRALYSEPIEIGVRIRDMDYVPGGPIVLWTDDRRIVFLRPDTAADPALAIERYLRDQASDPQIAEAAGTTFEACLQCHGLLENDVRAAPSLYKVCDRPLGSSSFDGYSGALASAGGRWDTERLAAFIANPESVAPGSAMSGWRLDNAEVAGLLARTLCSAS